MIDEMTDELALLCGVLGNELNAVARPILAGKPPVVQGAVLADLVAMWLAGHNVGDDLGETRKMRAALLAQFVAFVDQLTDLNARNLGTPHDPISRSEDVNRHRH